MLTLKDGSLLISSYRFGIFIISKIKNKFNTIKSPIENYQAFRKAVSIKDELWLASNEGGIFRWNRSTDVWQHYNLDSYKSSRTRVVVKDENENIWAGTTGGILLKYNNLIDDFETIMPQFQNGFGINTLLVVGHYIWFESGGLLYKYNIETNINTAIPLNLNKQNQFYIRSLYLSRDKNIIIGTHGQGVLVVDQSGKQLDHWRTELSSEDIFSLYEDEFENIWAGSWGGGLNRINTKTREVQVFNSANGLNDDTIFGVLPGVKGELWLSSYQGLMRFKNCINTKWPCQPSIQKFDEHDGLQGNEFDGDAYALLDTGELYFAGAKGINIFKPQNFEMYNIPPTMAITEIYVDNENYSGDISNIVIEYSHNKIQIEFVAFDYHDPISNKYQYKIDKNWEDLKTPHLEFLKLETGSYHLEIRGSNHDGVWSKEPLKLNITVKPPIYLSWGAINAYVLMLLALVLSIIRYREKTLRQEKVSLEEVVTLRTEQIFQKTQQLEQSNIEQNKLYSSISHEIKTPLTILLAPIEEMKDGDIINHQQLSTIKRQADDLKYYINNLVNLTNFKSIEKPQFGAHEVAPYLQSLVLDYEHLAKQKNIEMSLEIYLDKHIAVKSFKRSLNIIMNNLLDNALKHTPENGTIKIIATQTIKEITIKIEDSGSGIANVDSSFIHEYGKSDGLSWSWLNSLGIGLNTSYEIAKALGGEIKFENNNLDGASTANNKSCLI